MKLQKHEDLKERKNHVKQNYKKLRNMKRQHPWRLAVGKKGNGSNMHANRTTGEKLKKVSKNKKRRNNGKD